MGGQGRDRRTERRRARSDPGADDRKPRGVTADEKLSEYRRDGIDPPDIGGIIHEVFVEVLTLC